MYFFIERLNRQRSCVCLQAEKRAQGLNPFYFYFLLRTQKQGWGSVKYLSLERGSTEEKVRKTLPYASGSEVFLREVNVTDSDFGRWPRCSVDISE